MILCLYPEPETTEKDPLEATSSTFIGVPEAQIKKEQNVSLDNIQVVSFESHLKELKSVFKDCQVPKSTSDKILNVLHAFDPRYPVQEKRKEESKDNHLIAFNSLLINFNLFQKSVPHRLHRQQRNQSLTIPFLTLKWIQVLLQE